MKNGFDVERLNACTRKIRKNTRMLMIWSIVVGGSAAVLSVVQRSMLALAVWAMFAVGAAVFWGRGGMLSREGERIIRGEV